MVCGGARGLMDDDVKGGFKPGHGGDLRLGARPHR